MHCDVVCIHIVPRHVQELVLIFPTKRILLELFGFSGWWWWFSDFGDEIGGRSLCESVDKYANERYLDEDVEAQAEAEKYARAVFEPQLLLGFVILDACEVRLELTCVSEGLQQVMKDTTYQLAHERARGEVSLQKADEVPPWEKEGPGEDCSSWLSPNRSTKGVETGCRQDESAHIRHVGQTQHGQRDGCLPPLLCGVYHDGLLQRLLRFIYLGRVVGVLLEVLVVHGAEVVRVVGLVLLDVRLVYPAKRVHEPRKCQRV